MLSLELFPGKSAGPFVLGMPISEAITFIQAKNKIISHAELKYNEAEPFGTDIILDLNEDGVMLRFEPHTQILKSVIIYDVKKVILLYNKSVFNSPEEAPTLVNITETFGLTHPGEFESKMSTYFVHYPGLSFAFPIPQKYHQLYENNKGIPPTEFPNRMTPVANKIYLYTGSNFKSPDLPPIPIPSHISNRKDTEPIENSKSSSQSSNNSSIGTNSNKSNSSSISSREEERKSNSSSSGINPFLSSNSFYFEPIQVKLETEQENNKERKYLNYVFLEFGWRKCKLSFKSTTQDVLSELGAPSQIYYKEEDKMKIHSSSYDGLGCEDYFYNYFNYGIDILFDIKTHTVKKFILHSNFPCHHQFNRYVKCNYRIELPGDFTNQKNKLEKTEIISPDSKWQEVQTHLGGEGKPVVHNRGSNANPFGATLFFGYNNINLIFEVMQNNYIASVCIFCP